MTENPIFIQMSVTIDIQLRVWTGELFLVIGISEGDRIGSVTVLESSKSYILARKIWTVKFRKQIGQESSDSPEKHLDI